MLSNIEELYPGMKSIIEDIGLSAQGQENHHVRTAIDQRGEQIINKDGKSTVNIFIPYIANLTFLLRCVYKENNYSNHLSMYN